MQIASRKKEIERSAVAAHVWKENREVNTNPSLLKEINKKQHLTTYENIYIFKHPKNFNQDLSGINNPLLLIWPTSLIEGEEQKV